MKDIADIFRDENDVYVVSERVILPPESLRHLFDLNHFRFVPWTKGQDLGTMTQVERRNRVQAMWPAIHPHHNRHHTGQPEEAERSNSHWLQQLYGAGQQLHQLWPIHSTKHAQVVAATPSSFVTERKLSPTAMTQQIHCNHNTQNAQNVDGYGNILAQNSIGVTVNQYSNLPPYHVSDEDVAVARAPFARLPAAVPEPATHLPTHSRMPLSRNDFFVGRQRDRKQLASTIKGGDTAAISPIAAATGIGGIGKSQLAVEFAYRYGRYFAGGVFCNMPCSGLASVVATLPDFLYFVMLAYIVAVSN